MTGPLSKAILLSVMVATMAIPIIASRDSNAKRGMKKNVRWCLAFLVAYVLACLFVYPRLAS